MSDKSMLNLLRIRACDFDESKVNRDDDGKFAPKGGGGGGASALKEVAEAFKQPKLAGEKASKWQVQVSGAITKGTAVKLNQAIKKSLKDFRSRFDPAKEKLGEPNIVVKGDTTMKRYPEMQKRYDEIRAKEPQITKDLMEIVKAQGGQFGMLDFRTKGAKSLERKIKDNIANPRKDDVNTPEEAINAMGDIIRYTAMAPSHDKLGETCVNVVDGLKKAGYHIVELDNKWDNPTNEGYHGLHLEVVTPDWSQHFELQIHSNESLDIKARQHPLYEVIRVKNNGRALRNQLKHDSIKMGLSLPKPKGIEKLVSKENPDWRTNHQEVV